jgi:hypothetical protein
MLRCLREFGTFVVVGVHDDDSYFKVSRYRPAFSMCDLGSAATHLHDPFLSSL